MLNVPTADVPEVVRDGELVPVARRLMRDALDAERHAEREHVFDARPRQARGGGPGAKAGGLEQDEDNDDRLDDVRVDDRHAAVTEDGEDQRGDRVGELAERDSRTRESSSAA